MISLKDNKRASRYLILGDAFLEQKNYREALISYNQSMCYAESDSLIISLASAKRSDIYRVIEENIRSTKEFKSLDQDSKTHQIDCNDFFKLSHEPNKKIPYIASCLQICQDDKFGRFIVTDKDLNVGEIIAVEKLYLGVLRSSENVSRCHNCFKTNMMNLMPCNHCADVMFCSEECMSRLQFFHKLESEIVGEHKDEYLNCLRLFSSALSSYNNSIDELRLCVENNSSNPTVLDLDLSNPDDENFERNKLLAYMSLMPNESQRDLLENVVWPKFYDDNKSNSTLKPFWSSKENFDFFKKMFIEMFLRFTLNCHGMSWYSRENTLEGYKPKRNSFAAGVFLALSLISHSCAPNCDTMSVNGNQLALYVARPIKAGQQIFISYGKSFTVTPLIQRQEFLKAVSGFLCSCEACINNYPIKSQLKDQNFKFPSRLLMDSTEEALKEFKDNNKYIQEHHEASYPCREIDLLIDRNVFNIGCIASEWMRFQI